MYSIEISIIKQGTDVEKVESVLLEQFQRYEKTEAETVERPLQARVGSSYTTLRYRVYTNRVYQDLYYLFERLQHSTKSDIRVTLPRSTHVFVVDRPRAVD